MRKEHLSFWKKLLCTKEPKPVEYTVKESYLNTKVSTLTVLAEDLYTAKLFASDNRRMQRTMIEIELNGEIVSSQKNINSRWTDKSKFKDDLDQSK